MEHEIVKITVQLMGMFKDKSPPGNVLELAEGASISELLDMLQIEPDSIHLVMHNGKPERDLNRSLIDGDSITVLSPVGGG